jgi:hypothetical protein
MVGEVAVAGADRSLGIRQAVALPERPQAVQDLPASDSPSVSPAAPASTPGGPRGPPSRLPPTGIHPGGKNRPGTGLVSPTAAPLDR